MVTGAARHGARQPQPRGSPPRDGRRRITRERPAARTACRANAGTSHRCSRFTATCTVLAFVRRSPVGGAADQVFDAQAVFPLHEDACTLTRSPKRSGRRKRSCRSTIGHRYPDCGHGVVVVVELLQQLAARELQVLRVVAVPDIAGRIEIVERNLEADLAPGTAARVHACRVSRNLRARSRGQPTQHAEEQPRVHAADEQVVAPQPESARRRRAGRARGSAPRSSAAPRQCRRTTTSMSNSMRSPSGSASASASSGASG